MQTRRQYKVTTIPDDCGEKFTPSNCTCDVCRHMHISSREWETFKQNPNTNLQHRMINIIDQIETREIRKKK